MKKYLVYLGALLLSACYANALQDQIIVEATIGNTEENLQLLEFDYDYFANISIKNHSDFALCIPTPFAPAVGNLSPGRQALLDDKNNEIAPAKAFVSYEFPIFSYIIVPPKEEYKFQLPLGAYFDMEELRAERIYKYKYEFLGVFCNRFDSGFPNDDVNALPDHEIFSRHYNIVRDKEAVVLDTGYVEFILYRDS